MNCHVSLCPSTWIHFIGSPSKRLQIPNGYIISSILHNVWSFKLKLKLKKLFISPFLPFVTMRTHLKLVQLSSFLHHLCYVSLVHLCALLLHICWIELLSVYYSRFGVCVSGFFRSSIWCFLSLAFSVFWVYRLIFSRFSHYVVKSCFCLSP